MNDFEFIFVLYSLLLGLSLVELLTGLGRSLEMRLADKDTGGGVPRVGYLTPLLALFVLLDLLSFWIFAWRVRDLITVSPASLLAVMAFASGYFLAARLVFPSSPASYGDLDAHFFRTKRLVMAMLLVLLAVQWIYLLLAGDSRSAMISPLNIAITLLLVALMLGVMVVRSVRWNAILLLLLIVRYLTIYLR